MAIVRRPMLFVLLVGTALLVAMLMFGVGGDSQAASPAVAKAATAQTGSQAKGQQPEVRAHGRDARAHSRKSRHSGRKAARRSQTTAGDSGDNQSGDQTTPDNPSSEQENGGENEGAAEPPGEAQPGHEDPDGQNVQHECPPDCAPGELP
jgi:hypothetical protein